MNNDTETRLLANRYLIRSIVGKGGFGQTFLAEDTHSPSRRVRVVKQLKPQTDDARLYPVIRERFAGAREMSDALGCHKNPAAPDAGQRRVFRVGRGESAATPAGESTLISDETQLRGDSAGRGGPVNVAEPALLIRINQQYREGMSEQALYDSTRGIWKVGPRREGARYALAVFRGIVREVYVIDRWYPAGTTFVDRQMRVPGRWEFTGRVAEDAVRDKYIGRSVAHYFEQGNANPVFYVNC